MERMEVIHSAGELATRVCELGERISADYRGRELVLIGILNGAFILTADLSRAITIPHRIDFVRAASYGQATESCGEVRLSKDVELDLAGCDLLLVEDIVDSGRTLARLKEYLLAKGPASVRVCALIDKHERREVAVTVDYPGFTEAGGFLVGYGLDHAERHRHYSAIYRIDQGPGPGPGAGAGSAGAKAVNEAALQRKDRACLWHPFTQMHDYAERDLLLIDRAEGIMLYDQRGRGYFDTISSWWCIVHGHGHPVIKSRVRAQLDRLDQVLLAGVSHEPAILLAEKLVELTPASLSKVFYSDNGSTACEVAVKMSLQYWQQRGKPGRRGLVALERGYHGDTIGTMSLGGVPEFHQAFAHLLFPSHRVPPPYCYRCPAGVDPPAAAAEPGASAEPPGCDCRCLEPLAKLLAEKGDEIAAFILEPRILAAGGMIIYPAAWLRRAAELTRRHGVHLIFDEVASGFGRTGTMFALESADVEPDFLCLSKGLTGGMLPMAVTMTTDEIYQAFYDEYGAGKTFFHGHTFSGNPLAAAAALGSLEVFDREQTMAALPPKIAHLRQRLKRFRDLPWVGDLRTLGMIGVLELVRDREKKTPFTPAQRVGWPIYLAGLEEGLILRPLGNVVYLWLPLSTTLDQITEITERMWRVLSNPANIKAYANK